MPLPEKRWTNGEGSRWEKLFTAVVVLFVCAIVLVFLVGVLGITVKWVLSWFFPGW